MPPLLPPTNSRRKTSRDSKLDSEGTCGTVRCPDRVDLLFGKFRPWAGFARETYQAKDSCSMQEVVSGRDPFKVVEGVIGLDSILVVDLWQSVRIWNERLSKNAVDSLRGLHSILRETHCRVTVSVQDGLHQYLWILPHDRLPPSFLLSAALQSIHGTVLFDFIDSFVTHDRNAHHSSTVTPSLQELSS